jgi:hypothetical protein
MSVAVEVMIVNSSDVGQAILQGIERLNARLDRVETRFDSRMASIEAAVADIDVRNKTWPDMHFLAAAAKAQIVHMQEVKANVADVKTRLAEVYQAMATEPGIRNLRDDIARFREQSVDLVVRVGTIENHLQLGMKVP